MPDFIVNVALGGIITTVLATTRAPSSASDTGILVCLAIISTSRLLWFGSRCCTSTKAISLSAGVLAKNALNAVSHPPPRRRWRQSGAAAETKKHWFHTSRLCFWAVNERTSYWPLAGPIGFFEHHLRYNDPIVTQKICTYTLGCHSLWMSIDRTLWREDRMQAHYGERHLT
jgi:hypothetical protein